MILGGAPSGSAGETVILRDAFGQGRVEAPLGGFAVGFAAGAVAGGEPGDLEPGMVLEQLNVALAHHAGGAEDADWMFGLHGLEHSSVPDAWTAIRRQGSGFDEFSAHSG